MLLKRIIKDHKIKTALFEEGGRGSADRYLGNSQDGECAESNEKSHFRFFRIKVLSYWPPKRLEHYFFQKWPNLQGRLGLI